jgi:hypothetical protein
VIAAIFELLLEIVVQTQARAQESGLWTFVACFLVGVLIGAISTLIVGHRLTPVSPWPGVSLVLAPLGTGLVMRRLGDVWEERGKSRPILFSFRAGAIFAFGLALARFA